MSLDDLLPRDKTRDETYTSLFAGVVLDTAGDDLDEVRVRLDVDRDQYVGPMGFTARVTMTGDPPELAWALPEAGDECLVGFDEKGKPWLLDWR